MAITMLASSSNAEGFWIVLVCDVLFGVFSVYHLKKGLDLAVFGVLLSVVGGVIIINAGP